MPQIQADFIPGRVALLRPLTGAALIAALLVGVSRPAWADDAAPTPTPDPQIQALKAQTDLLNAQTALRKAQAEAAFAGMPSVTLSPPPPTSTIDATTTQPQLLTFAAARQAAGTIAARARTFLFQKGYSVPTPPRPFIVLLSKDQVALFQKFPRTGTSQSVSQRIALLQGEADGLKAAVQGLKADLEKRHHR